MIAGAYYKRKKESGLQQALSFFMANFMYWGEAAISGLPQKVLRQDYSFRSAGSIVMVTQLLSLRRTLLTKLRMSSDVRLS